MKLHTFSKNAEVGAYLLNLIQQVTRHDNGFALRGDVSDELTNFSDTLWVQSIGGLVQHQTQADRRGEQQLAKDAASCLNCTSLNLSFRRLIESLLVFSMWIYSVSPALFDVCHNAARFWVLPSGSYKNMGSPGWSRFFVALPHCLIPPNHSKPPLVRCDYFEDHTQVWWFYHFHWVLRMPYTWPCFDGQVELIYSCELAKSLGEFIESLIHSFEVDIGQLIMEAIHREL